MKTEILNIIARMGDLDAAKIDTSAKFTELGFDSLDLVELIMEFERTFKISVPDEDMESLETVQQAIDYITNRCAV